MGKGGRDPERARGHQSKRFRGKQLILVLILFASAFLSSSRLVTAFDPCFTLPNLALVWGRNRPRFSSARWCLCGNTMPRTLFPEQRESAYTSSRMVIQSMWPGGGIRWSFGGCASPSLPIKGRAITLVTHLSFDKAAVPFALEMIIPAPEHPVVVGGSRSFVFHRGSAVSVVDLTSSWGCPSLENRLLPSD